MRTRLHFEPPSSRHEATARLRELAWEVNTQQGYLKKLDHRSAFELTMCLAIGADPDARLEIPETGNPYGPKKQLRVLDIMLRRPYAALRLVERGAQVEQGTVEKLAWASCMQSKLTDEDDVASYASLALLCAQKFPGLNWYEDVSVPIAALYSKWPANMVIEQRAPGFNAALEQAQAKAGLIVGHHPEELKVRQEIIRDLASIEPCLIWAGSKPRVDILRQLMRDDVSADLAAEKADTKSPVRLLEYFLINHADLEIIKELLDRGATVGSIDFLSAVNDLAVLDPHTHDQDRHAVLEMLLRHASFGLDDPWPDGFLPGEVVREFLHRREPRFLAQYEQDLLLSATHTPAPRAGAIRL